MEQEVRPAPPPEGELIGAALKKSGMSARQAAARAEISDTRWRHIVTGFQPMGDNQFIRVTGPAMTIARMAQVVSVTPEQLRAANRTDAADVLEQLEAAAAAPHPDQDDELERVIRQLYAVFTPEQRHWFLNVLRELVLRSIADVDEQSPWMHGPLHLAADQQLHEPAGERARREQDEAAERGDG